MKLILSPSKSLDFDSAHPVKKLTQPQFLKESEALVKKLKTLSAAQIGKMMEISDRLAALNYARFQEFTTPFTLKNAKPALFAFTGDVYGPIEVNRYNEKQLAFAQAHVRILSGLYGILRPLDLIQPYRLEMGRKLTMGKTKDLYGFWGDKLAKSLAAELKKDEALINLASEEYAQAVDREALGRPVIDIIFKEKQKDKLKIIGLFAKKARGMMTNYIIQNQIDKPDQLKEFAVSDYGFEPKLSGPAHYVFVRKAS